MGLANAERLRIACAGNCDLVPVAGSHRVESDGTLVRGSTGATATQLFKPTVDGSYEVVFMSDVTGCALTATIGRTDSANLDPLSGEIGTAYRNGVPNAVYVKTRDSAGSKADRPFHVTVLC